MCKAVDAIEGEEAGTTEAEGEINLLTKNTGKIRNTLILIIRDSMKISVDLLKLHKEVF